MLYKTLIAAAVLALAGTCGLAGADRQDRPGLPECGSALPEGVHYSIELNGRWDTRSQPPAGAISITLTDEISGSTPVVIPDEAEGLVACVRAAVGLDTRPGTAG